MARAVRPALLLVAALAVTVGAGVTLRGRAGAPTAESLRPAALRAAAALRAHQLADGSWPTAFTNGPVFEGLGDEVNAFVPSVIVDLVGPVAAEAGLAEAGLSEAGLSEAMTRARAWLTSRIEPTGLVRYLRVPDSVLRAGYEIPPDADDTALVWRLAPGKDAALRGAALRVIEGYRTEDGLYRTWLASEDAAYFKTHYGERPENPADVCIQLHVLLLLAEQDPQAAKRLFDALGPRMADDRIWVYYRVAPFIPLLREADLALAGYPLRVPAARLQDQPEAQAPYLELAALRRRLLLKEDPEAARTAALRTLKCLAADDFAAIERAPPLLYHNDFNAVPPCFYWSADVGYALWLRCWADAAR